MDRPMIFMLVLASPFLNIPLYIQCSLCPNFQDQIFGAEYDENLVSNTTEKVYDISLKGYFPDYISYGRIQDTIFYHTSPSVADRRRFEWISQRPTLFATGVTSNNIGSYGFFFFDDSIKRSYRTDSLLVDYDDFVSRSFRHEFDQEAGSRKYKYPTVSNTSIVLLGGVGKFLPQANMYWKRGERIIWSYDLSNESNHTCDNLGKYDGKYESPTISLSISGISKKDSGFYKLYYGANENNSTVISINLNVEGDPIIEFYGSIQFYEIGSNIDLICDVFGSEVQNVRIFWFPCKGQLAGDCLKNAKADGVTDKLNPLDTDKRLIVNGTEEYVRAIYTTKAQQTGYYICSVGSYKKVLPVTSTLAKNGYHIEKTISYDNISDESELSMVCFVNSFRFIDSNIKDISWTSGGKLIDRKAAQIVLHRLDEFTTSSNLIIPKINRTSHARQYECNVLTNGGVVIGTESERVYDYEIPESLMYRTSSIWLISGIVSAVGLLIVFSVLVTYLYVRKRKNSSSNSNITVVLFKDGQVSLINPDLSLIDQADLIPYDTRYEIDRKRIKLGKTLGQGEFGRVVLATATKLAFDIPKESAFTSHDGGTVVAVKMVNDRTSKDQLNALMTELKILRVVGHHPNIVNLLGACTSGLMKGDLLVIVEYCHRGNLRQYLISNRENFVSDDEKNDSVGIVTKPTGLNDYLNVDNLIGSNSVTQISPSDLISYSFQVARGMEYLTSRRMVHRDLAARNILLTHKDIVKICDFGLAREFEKYDEYIRTQNIPLPIKWMAPESILDRIFTSKSDIWSYGVLLWEMFTLGSTPYAGQQVNEDFIANIMNGVRLNKPDHCPDAIFESVILGCWEKDPSDRHDFSQICNQLDRFIKSTDREFYLELEKQYLTDQFDFQNYIDVKE